MERDVNHMIKRIISLVLLSTVLLSSCVVMAADVNLTDIDASHWAYNSIYELVSKGTVNGYPDGSFRPNGTVTFAEFKKMITGVWEENPKPINREAALDMLWEHNNKPTTYKAPGIITKQMQNKDAVAWGYSTGLMQGNDGLNLRPYDTLTRAEAATLIIRSTKAVSGNYSFENSVSEDILKVVWDNYNLFDSEYVANEEITVADLQTAVNRLGDFIRKDITVTGNTIEDAAIALIYSSIVQSDMNQVSIADKSSASDKYGFVAQHYAAYGFENGITLTNNKNKVATKKDIALLLIQIDDLIGRGGAKINKDISKYPANHADFAYIAEGVPSIAYTTAFDGNVKPIDFYKFVFNFPSIFNMFVGEMEGKYCNGNAKFTIIPSLICQNKDEAIFRVKCTLTGNKSAYDIFGAGYENAGKEFYMDLHAGDVVKNIYLPIDTAKIGKFICNQ